MDEPCLEAGSEAFIVDRVVGFHCPIDCEIWFAFKNSHLLSLRKTNNELVLYADPLIWKFHLCLDLAQTKACETFASQALRGF